jgi:hypothetical protein
VIADRAVIPDGEVTAEAVEDRDVAEPPWGGFHPLTLTQAAKTAAQAPTIRAMIVNAAKIG